MSQVDERRAPGLKRVPVEALVEICGRDADGAPAFEAESVDVSGRGMHVRTAYLPEVGAPLVCRFEHDGREIVVEGQVAWRDEADLGGEFGIEFTALDSGSVDALRELCGLETKEAEAEAPAAEPSPEPPVAGPDRGARVRLHIEGLGSPMKASVREGSRRKLQVSSNLEFLKVGRQLELEELGSGSRRPAQIHGVDVVIDPATRVPQLVVALRFDDGSGDEITPEPSVIDSGHAVTPRSPVHPARSFSASAVASEPAGSASTAEGEAFDEFAAEPEAAPAEFAEEEEVMEDAERFQSRLGTVAAGAGDAAKKTGAVLAQASTAAASGMGRLFKGAAAKIAEYREKKQARAAPKRTTAAPPSGVLSADGRRLRPQSSASPAAAQSAPPAAPGGKLSRFAKHPKAKKYAGIGALLVLVTTVSVIAMKKPTPPPGAESEPDAVSTTVSADVTQVDEEGNPIAVAKTEPAAAVAPTPAASPAAKLTDSAEPSGDGITADVPLFGPTPMATMEPAPLGPAPGAEGTLPEAESEEDGEKAAAAEVENESWSDKGKSDDKKPAARVNPSDVKPWGRGRLELPTIHRLRLDTPGGAIKGAVNPTGFTIVIPGVKVMESAKGIEKRDDRIARVKVRNGSSGAEITFQFREHVPGYRVRLRKDFVEFLISAPSKKNVVSTKSSHKSSKAKSSAKTASTKSTKKSGKKKRKKN